MAYKDRRKLSSDLNRRYNISTLIYEAILEGSDRTCMLCSRHESEVGTLNLDHCHNTSKLRGLLCRDCNLGLSYFKDDPELLEKAIQYLSGDMEER